eukprot:gene561-1082_t
MSIDKAFFVESFEEDLSCDDEVRDTIEFLWTKVSLAIQEKWLASIEVPMAAEVAMSKINRIVAWSVMGHDGEVIPNKVLEHKKPDLEPTPVHIDPWARGAVPVKKVVHPESDMYRPGSGIGSDGTRSVSQASGMSSERSSTAGSSRSGRSSNYSSKVMLAVIEAKRRASALSTKSSRDGNNISNGVNGIIELEEEDRTTNTFPSTANLYEIWQRTEKQKKNGDATESVKDEFDLIQEEIDRVTKEMKGKKFTLDVDGKPVPVSQVEAARLPPFSYQLDLNITSGNTEPYTKPKEGLPKKKKQRIRVAGSRDIDNTYFVPSSSLATSLSGTNIVLNPGVSIRTNETIREGPPPAEDPNKPSRKTYMRTQITQSQGHMGSSSGGGLGSYTLDSPGTFTASNALQSLDNTSPQTRSPSTMLPQHSFRANRFVDIDPTEGGRKTEEKKSESYVSDDAELGLGPVVTMGKPNPGKLPAKPSTSQDNVVKQLFGGVEQAGPRDRENPRAQVALSHRKRGPPAPMGQVQQPRSMRSQNSDDNSHQSISFSLTAPSSLTKEGKIKAEPILRQLFNSVFAFIHLHGLFALGTLTSLRLDS